MLANLWMLKAPNGMFWYAVDYLKALQVPTTVIVRPRLLDEAKRHLNAQHLVIRTGGFASLVRLALQAVARGELVYCPTPHPFPGIRNQIVVFHDAYPFEGSLGRIKLKLFRWGLLASRCRVAYINESMARPYLESIGLRQSRLVHAPNMPPSGAAEKGWHGRKNASRAFRLAAFGTDSSKKRYPELLEHLSQSAYGDGIELCLYGENNAYVASLRERFPRARLSVIPPSRLSLQEFLSDVDAVIGIARNEGFGRPVATAIMQGVPCYLSDSPTFREFFSGLAILSDDLETLFQAALRGDRPPAASGRGGTGFQSLKYQAAIGAAVLLLRAMERSASNIDDGVIRHP